MTALMVQGVSSSAGKSLLVTALARRFARRGVRVAPFKGQNMSNNARVVEGGEIGVAQWLQARAAGIEPEARMNPVLVKPEADTRSQVVVRGRPDFALSELPWRERGPRLWPTVEESLRSLLADYELVLLEGAGSPAEINLRSTDLANMRAAHVAGARVVLVADIDRGGAFAHLYGVGVLPWLEHGLPDEDGAAVPRLNGRRPRVAVLRYPTASNLDEFRPLEQVADVVWAQTPADPDGATLAVLPGSKVAGDRAWLRARGFDLAIAARAEAGCCVLAICGGLQLLGDIGLLPLRTTYAHEKLTRKTSTAFADLPEPWSALSGKRVEGYETRQGSSVPTAPLAEALPDGLGFVAGSVLAVYVHGLFEQPEVVRALVGAAPTTTLEDVFDRLADAFDEHLDMDTVVPLAGVA